MLRLIDTLSIIYLLVSECVGFFSCFMTNTTWGRGFLINGCLNLILIFIAVFVVPSSGSIAIPLIIEFTSLIISLSYVYYNFDREIQKNNFAHVPHKKLVKYMKCDPDGFVDQKHFMLVAGHFSLQSTIYLRLSFLQWLFKWYYRILLKHSKQNQIIEKNIEQGNDYSRMFADAPKESKKSGRRRKIDEI